MLDTNGFKVNHAVEIATQESEIVQRLAVLLWAAMSEEHEFGVAWRNSETNEILHVNKRMEDLLGWTLAEFNSMPFEDLFFPDDWPMILIHASNNSSYPVKTKLAMKGGGYKEVFAQALSFNIGNVLHRVTVIKEE